MNIAVGMIIFNGNYVLRECLESIYPYASQILISEGPVKYWQEQGYTTSTDGTNDILDNFPDPDNKIKIVHGQFDEKDDQCNAYMQYLNDDADYIWNIDCDEIFKSEDIEKLIEILKKERPTSVGFKSCSFYGGFHDSMGGFEENVEFMRIRKVYPGSYWATHRPPTIAHKMRLDAWSEKHLDHNTLYNNYRIKMYHYSYVFPDQVYQKINYYKTKISKDNAIDNYFDEVYLPWVLNQNRNLIEQKYLGVHEFKPQYRGECYTKPFTDTHPDAIIKNMTELMSKFDSQLEKYLCTNT